MVFFLYFIPTSPHFDLNPPAHLKSLGILVALSQVRVKCSIFSSIGKLKTCSSDNNSKRKSDKIPFSSPHCLNTNYQQKI